MPSSVAKKEKAENEELKQHSRKEIKLLKDRLGRLRARITGQLLYLETKKGILKQYNSNDYDE